MPELDPLDVEGYLEPISPGNSAGDYLRWEEEYAEIEEARRSDEDTSDSGVWSKVRKRSDWNKVIALGDRILRSKSKDLQVVAWMTEAWAHLHGLAGIRDGLNLIRAIQERFWEEAHPDHGDLEYRAGIYELLDDPKQLPLRIRNLPITREGSGLVAYSYLKYKESRDTENALRKSLTEEQKEMLEGNLRGEEFDKAAAATPRQFYVDLLAEVADCRTAVVRCNTSLEERWPKSGKGRAPQLRMVEEALGNVEALAKQLLGRKPVPPPEPAPDDRSDPDEDDSSSDTTTSWRDEADEGEFADSASPVTAIEERPSSRPGPKRPSASAGELTSPDEAIDRIADSAHYLRQSDPADPVSYLILRALRAGGLYGGDDAPDPRHLPPPDTDVRLRLKVLSRAEDGEHWAELLDASERALGRPEGRGWIDPHSYSVRALEALGHDGAARACRAILAAFLRDHPRWPECELSDGTPCASGPTRAWILSERLGVDRPADVVRGMSQPDSAAGSTARGTDEAPPGPSDGPPEPPDPWQEALALRQTGRLNDAIAVMVRSVRHARTGRERFLRTLQQAELCLGADRPSLALPLLELLAQRIDDLRLDQWEDNSLCARVLALLYRCLKGRDDARALVIYNRLCQLDAGEALLLGGD
jgi:type VI secretion system ImpA family protein